MGDVGSIPRSAGARAVFGIVMVIVVLASPGLISVVAPDGAVESLGLAGMATIAGLSESGGAGGSIPCAPSR